MDPALQPSKKSDTQNFRRYTKLFVAELEFSVGVGMQKQVLDTLVYVGQFFSIHVHRHPLPRFKSVSKLKTCNPGSRSFFQKQVKNNWVSICTYLTLNT